MSKYEFVDDEYEKQLADMGAEVLYAGRVLVEATAPESWWADPWVANIVTVKPDEVGDGRQTAPRQ